MLAGRGRDLMNHCRRIHQRNGRIYHCRHREQAELDIPPDERTSFDMGISSTHAHRTGFLPSIRQIEEKDMRVVSTDTMCSFLVATAGLFVSAMGIVEARERERQEKEYDRNISTSTFGITFQM